VWNQIVRPRLIKLKENPNSLVVAIAVTASILISAIALDFGRHWDEIIQFDLVHDALNDKTTFPTDFYNYPSLTYWLAFIGYGIATRFNIVYPSDLVTTDAYEFTRLIFVIASTSIAVWLYLALRKFVRESIALAMSLMSLASYQFAYHSRWIAPDAVLAAVFALFIWVFCNAASTGRLRWFYASFVVAGIAASTKWQGAILVVPSLLLVGRLNLVDRRTRKRVVLAGIGIFVVVVVVITPGLLFQTGEAIKDIRFELNHYATTHGTIYGVAPNDVSSHFQYVANMLAYLSLNLTSRFWYISLALFVLSFFGAYCLSRKDKLISFGIAMPAVLLFLLFANQSVFIVRNFLVFLPVILFFAGFAINSIQKDVARQLTVLCLFVFSLLGMIGNFSDARDVGPNWQEVAFRKLNSEIDNHPNREYFLSPGVQSLVSEFDDHGYPNLVECSARTQNIVMLASELSRFNGALRELPALRDGTYKTLGQNEVDFDFYPSWAGNDRILIMNENDQKRFGISCSGLGP